jgi:uncharacterized repeat protein (TIGR01451 family)
MNKFRIYLYIISFLTLMPYHAFGAITDWQVNGSTTLSGNQVIVTKDLLNQAGSVWNLNKISLAKDFTITSTVYLGSKDANGADGIAFVLQNSPAGLNAFGDTTGGGEWIGMKGIYPAIGIELDTWQNTNRGDPTCDHLGIDVYPADGTGLPNHAGGGPSCNVASTPNVEDGLEHTLTTYWNATTKTLIISFDGAQRITYTNDIVNNIFGGVSEVYLGYTGSTGAYSNLQYFYLGTVSQDAEMAVTKTVNTSTPSPNDNVIYTVSLHNNGPINGSGMKLTDLLPSGLTYVSATPSQGTYTSASGLWDVGGTVAVGATATLAITAKVNQDMGGTTIANTAAITAAGQFDTVAANNQASVSLTPRNATITAAKVVDLSTVLSGATVTYTITITNTATADGYLTNVQDTLPVGFSYKAGTTTGFTTSNPAISGQVLTWAGGWVIPRKVGAVNGTLTLTFKAKTGLTGGTFFNIVTASGANITIVTSGNAAPVTVQVPTIALLKTAGGTSTPGSTITYTVYYHNTGNASATNIVILDTVPANTAYVAGSLRMGNAASTYATATPKTDAVDGDSAEISGTDTVFRLNSVTADDSVPNSGTDEGKVYFQVKIN